MVSKRRDRYSGLREALERKPTDGPWFTGNDPRTHTIVCDVSGWGLFKAIGYNSVSIDAEANAAYVAECDPVTIRALLKERDRLLELVRKHGLLEVDT